MSFEIEYSQINKLHETIKDFPDNAESAINSVLHDEGSQLIQENIRNLMPVSGASWRGKKGAAKTSNSLTDKPENLAITVKTSKAYQYLYFPDDGSNTRRHAGMQQFFKRGGEASVDEIVERCISRVVNKI